MNLYAPKEFWELSEEERSRGCGPGQGVGDKLVADHILGLRIGHACAIHDYMWALGETIEDFDRANRVFINNIYRLIQGGSRWLRFPRRIIANFYYEAVQGPIGALIYWYDKNKPENMGN